MQTLRKRGGPVSKIFFGPSGLRLSKINGEGGGGGGHGPPPLDPLLLLSIYIPRSHYMANFAQENLPPSVCVKSVLLINPRHPVLAYCTPISPDGPVVSLALNRSSVWLSSPVMK